MGGVWLWQVVDGMKNKPALSSDAITGDFFSTLAIASSD
jgi:hypothetical protein